MAIIDYEGKVTYEGCVIRTWEHNGYDDSDFYAECVNTETGKIDTVEYDTTRCGGGGSATVDLTADNYALYLHNGGKDRELLDAINVATNKAKLVGKGKEVIVVAGRKVKHGIIGEVFWEKTVNYDMYHRWWNEETKIGIKDNEGNVYWTYAKNVNVVDYRRYVDVAGIKEQLNRKHSNIYMNLKGGTR